MIYNIDNIIARVKLCLAIDKIITKNNILRWKSTDKDSKKPIDIGDANSPDAPWMKNKSK